MRMILASASPRRKELLKKLFTDFEVAAAKGAERYTKRQPSEIVQELSMQKASEVEQSLFRVQNGGLETDADYLILGADTVVAFEDQILGKPQNKEHAKQMLHMLSGTVHQVYTGVAVLLQSQGIRRQIQLAQCTHVRFYPMTAAEIDAYVESGEPMDKAGAYGIQGLGGRFVQGIEGDYENVVGLPVAKLYHVLKKIDEIALPFCAFSTMIKISNDEEGGTAKDESV